jgi:hypothetical protein
MKKIRLDWFVIFSAVCILFASATVAKVVFPHIMQWASWKWILLPVWATLGAIYCIVIMGLGICAGAVLIKSIAAAFGQDVLTKWYKLFNQKK